MRSFFLSQETNIFRLCTKDDRATGFQSMALWCHYQRLACTQRTCSSRKSGRSFQDSNDRRHSSADKLSRRWILIDLSLGIYTIAHGHESCLGSWVASTVTRDPNQMFVPYCTKNFPCSACRAFALCLIPLVMISCLVCDSVVHGKSPFPFPTQPHMARASQEEREREPQGWAFSSEVIWLQWKL